jgi:tetratricopeptide (TPR) repeat protein
MGVVGVLGLGGLGGFGGPGLWGPRVAWADGRGGGGAAEEEQLFQAAEAAFNADRFDEAARLYEKVLALNPSHRDAYLKRAVIYYQRKEYSAAVKLLREAQRTLPSDLGIKAQLGLTYYKLGVYDWAVQFMEEATSKAPQQFPSVWLQLGQHYLGGLDSKDGGKGKQDGQKAVAAFQAYFRARPEKLAADDVKYRPLLGNAYLLDGQYAEAQREFEQALRQSPGDLTTRLGLATAYTAAGEYSKAIALYEKLLGEAKNEPSIHYNLGASYLRTNRPRDAERQADAYTRAREQDAKGWLLLGDARLANHDDAGALAAYEQAHKRDPGNSMVPLRLGMVHLGVKRYREAESVLETARKLRPDDLEVLAGLVDVYKVTRPQDTKQLTELGERLGRSTNAEALTAAGVAYYVADNDALAEAAFTRAQAADPRAPRPRLGLEMTLNRAADKALAKGALAEAEGLLLRAQKLAPDSVQTSRNLALVLLLEKKYTEAEKALGPARQKLGRDAVVNRLLGRIYQALGRKDEAIKAYQAAADVAQQSRGLALAQVDTDLGQLYIETGRLDQAVDVLETAVREAGAGPANASLVAAAQHNLAVAYYRRGLGRLRDGKQSDQAYDDLSRAAALPMPALAGRELANIQCVAAVAAFQAGRFPQMQEALARVSKDGKDSGCQFMPPYDKLGAELLMAYAQYRTPQDAARREAALKTFNKLLPRATGNTADILRDLIRSSYEIEGYESYQRNDVRRAQAALQVAQRVVSKSEHRSLDHNLAVLELTDGRLSTAERAFEQLGSRPPEALLNLGILRDRQGDARKALELYRKALERGVRNTKLKEWIDIKERLLASPGAARDDETNRPSEDPVAAAPEDAPGGAQAVRGHVAARRAQGGTASRHRHNDHAPGGHGGTP